MKNAEEPVVNPVPVMVTRVEAVPPLVGVMAVILGVGHGVVALV